MKKTNLLAAAVVAGAVIYLAGAAFSSSNLKTDLLNGDFQQMDMEQQQAQQFSQELKNEKQHLNDRKNECKNMATQVKQAKKSGSKKAAELEGQVAALCTAVGQYITQLGSVTDMDELSDVRSTIQDDINQGFQDLWDSLNSLNAESNVLRGIKENKSACKNFARELKDISREAKRAKIDVTSITARGQAKVTECEVNYKQLQSYAANGQFDEANDLLQDFFWNNETHEFFQGLRDEAQACSGISRIVSDSDREIKMIKKALAKFKKMGLDTSVADDYFAQALDIIAQAKDLAKAGTCDKDAAEELGSQLEEIGGLVQQEIEDLKYQAE